MSSTRERLGWLRARPQGRQRRRMGHADHDGWHARRHAHERDGIEVERGERLLRDAIAFTIG